MNLKQMMIKVVNKISDYLCRLFDRDPITFIKVIHLKDLKEIGTKYGGWVIPSSLINSESICYCVGCGEDISFDLGLIEQFGCNVFGFDPTPRAIQYVRQNAGKNIKYIFGEVGLWDKEDNLKFYAPKNSEHVSHSLLNLQKTQNYITIKVNRLIAIMKNNGHNKLDLLKLDIEGAEYAVIDSIIADNLDIKIICVEYDECFNALDSNYRKRIRISAHKLITSGYSLVCVQGNGNYTFVKNV